MSKRTRSDGRQRRTAILDAALEVFLARGPLAATLDEIRQLSGASPSSLYHHFGGRDAIALALLQRTFTRLFGVLNEAVCGIAEAEASVLTLVRTHIDWCFSQRDQATFMYQLTTVGLSDASKSELQVFKADLLAPLAMHFMPFMMRGELPQLPPVAFDVLAMGPTHEACRRALAGAPLDEDWIRATLPPLAWAALRACAAQQTAQADGIIQ